MDTFDTEATATIEDNDINISNMETVQRFSNFFSDIYSLPSEWREAAQTPEELKQTMNAKVDAQVTAKTITAEQGEKMKTAIDGAFSFNPTVLATKQQMIDSINYQLGVEIAIKKQENDQLKTTSQQIKFYGSETIRRVKGMSKVDAMTNGIGAASFVTSAIQKFQTGDAGQIVSGVLDITNAVSLFLKPPTSVYVQSFSAILGMFFPGAEGPSNADVINAMVNLFEEQKQFITEEFAKQKAFIEEQFDEAINKIGSIITAEKLAEIKTQSIAGNYYLFRE